MKQDNINFNDRTGKANMHILFSMGAAGRAIESIDIGWANTLQTYLVTLSSEVEEEANNPLADEEAYYAGLASTEDKRGTVIESNNRTRLKMYEPITKLNQIGHTWTKKLEYNVLKASVQFCDALPCLDEDVEFPIDADTPYHYVMTVSLTNVDFGNRSGGAPKELPLYKKPKITLVSTSKNALKAIFDALQDIEESYDVDPAYDLNLISSENEGNKSLVDQVESLYSEKQMDRVRPKSKVRKSEDIMNESAVMYQTGEKRRRHSEEARDSNHREFYEEQVIQYSHGPGGSPFRSSPSGISNESPTASANAHSDSHSQTIAIPPKLQRLVLSTCSHLLIHLLKM